MINKSQQSLGFDFNEEEEVNNRAAMSKNDNSNIVDSISSEGLTNQGNKLIIFTVDSHEQLGKASIWPSILWVQS